MIKLCPEILKKTPAEIKYYNFDCAEDMEDGETISSQVVTVSPAGPTLATPSVSGQEVQVKVSGGTAGVRYMVHLKITTSGGETIEADGYLRVEE